ncbi:MAG: hypothetical protein JWP29_5403, partial [Rhodoferax sp.]|nr:hypothetical protein [Rhodoferax sp.]
MHDTQHPSVSLLRRNAARPLTSAIEFTTGTCSHGDLLVARNGDGLCAIFMDDTMAGLAPQLAAAFPGRLLMDASAAMAGTLAQVAKFIDEPHADGRLALSIGGTPFQQLVWAALCDVPAGATTTYAALAQAIGAPD